MDGKKRPKHAASKVIISNFVWYLNFLYEIIQIYILIEKWEKTPQTSTKQV